MRIGRRKTEKMKKILVIGTGGTIASKPTQNGLAPALSADALMEAIPYASTVCEVTCTQAFSLDSTNVRPGHWLILENIIEKNYDKFDGFVIAHGTDTLAYSAAGLSYLISNSRKPIVLTGAQRPIGEDVTDAKQNLIDALIYASDDDSHNVTVVFNDCVIAGTRARKNYSKNFAAFTSVNFPFLAQIQDHRIIRYFPDAAEGETCFSDYINPNVGLIKLTPGMNNKMMRNALECYDGLIIESFGVGGLPEYSDYYEQVREAGERGKFIVMTTQVPNEGSDLSVYRVGAVIKEKLRILEARDMTSEAALAKLMWILGKTNDFDKAKEMFYRQVHHDILCRES